MKDNKIEEAAKEYYIDKHQVYREDDRVWWGDKDMISFAVQFALHWQAQQEPVPIKAFIRPATQQEVAAHIKEQYQGKVEEPTSFKRGMRFERLVWLGKIDKLVEIVNGEGSVYKRMEEIKKYLQG